MTENRQSPDLPNNPVKMDQVRNIPGPNALLRAIPSSQSRFLMAGPQAGSTALISTSTTIQTQVIPKVTAPSGNVQSTVSRISTVPIQATSSTGYHVPRGPAAVANISSVPRSSFATPIVRAPTSLQPIGVAPQHSMPLSGTTTSRPVGVACLPGPPRPPPISSGARFVSSQMRPIGEVQPRPLLVHAHKQVTLTQQQVQSTLQMSGAVKSYSNVNRHPTAPPLPRFTTALTPSVVFLPTQPTKSQPPSKVISPSTQAQGIQMPTVTSSVPQTLSLSPAVSRPVVIGSGTVGSPVRPAVKPSVTSSAEATQSLYIPGRSTILVRESSRTKESEPISISISSCHTTTAATTSAAVNTIYTIPGPAYFDEGGGSVRPLATLAPVSRPIPAIPATSSQPMRLNPVMVMEPPRIHSLIPPATSEISLGTSTITESSNSLTTSVPGVPISLTKQVTSPRPSILRKRDSEGSPMKGPKSLTPLLSSMGNSNSPPTLPPSPPPKRAESSSGGSTTMSANSSPGESPPSVPIPLQKEDEEPQPPPPPPPPPSSVPSKTFPPEVSPRKKPRKQQLSGNQISESTYSDDEMEFITEEKNKRDMKEGMESKVITKRRTMSLLSTYKSLWKARNNHFLRYTDIKPREEKGPSITEIANQKYALQKCDGWKIYHLASQIEDMVCSEDEIIKFFDTSLSEVEITQKINKNRDVDKDISRINERFRANFQRTKVNKDQMLDAKNQMMKLFNHKTNVAEFVSKNISKRTSHKKRERI